MLALSSLSVSAQQVPGSPYLRTDPDRIVITDASGMPCANCHEREVAQWKATKHARGFEEMHRTASAKEFMTALGFRVAKRQEALCMRCHYTVGAERVAVAGVSCESCHGGAKEWLNIHNKFAGGAKDAKGEPLTEEDIEAMMRAKGYVV